MLPFLLAALTFEMPYVVIALLVGICAFAIMYGLAQRKSKIDAEEEKLSEAAGGAQWVAGLPELANVLRKAGTGNIKRTFQAARELYNKYFKTDRGPLMLARDVFVKSWPHLREDKEYGNQVREIVVSTALGFNKDDLKKNLDFSKAGGRFERIGWPKVAKAASALATDEYSQMTNSMVSLVEEVLEDDGEKKLALRVAKPTIDAVFNDPKFHDQLMPILRDYVAKDDARIAAEDAKAMEKAKALIAAESAAPPRSSSAASKVA